MNSMERMSWVALRESDMWNGEMEKRVIEGTAHIVDQLHLFNVLRVISVCFIDFTSTACFCDQLIMRSISIMNNY